MPIDPRISLGVQQLQIADPLAQYGQVQNILAAQAQRQSAGTQNELAQAHLAQTRMSIQEVQEAKDVIDKMMAAAKQNGATVSDPMEAATQMLQHPNPKVREAGGHLFDANQKVLAYQQDKSFINRAAPQPIQATQLPLAPGAQTNFGLNDDSYKTWMADKTTNLDFKPWLEQQNAKQTNALAPAPVAAVAPAPTNALATSSKADQLLAEINDLRTRFPYSAKAKEQITFLTKQYEEATKPHVVGANLVSGEGKEIYTGKTKDSEFEQLLAKSGLPEDEKMAMRVARAKKESTHPQPISVTVSTEKAYGSQLAGKVADADIAKMSVAEKAPQLAESANRIINLVQQGNLFTGPVADVKLNLARALNVVGASNDEKIANTEALIAATGQSTLDAIKSAGLGTGQGFTDKDLKFLQGIAGGTITYTPQTLTELARLQHQAATRSAESWNNRVKQLPKSATEGMNLSTEPIKVPPLTPNAMFAVNPKTGERIQSLDGGNTWKPVGGK